MENKQREQNKGLVCVSCSMQMHRLKAQTQRFEDQREQRDLNPALCRSPVRHVGGSCAQKGKNDDCFISFLFVCRRKKRLYSPAEAEKLTATTIRPTGRSKLSCLVCKFWAQRVSAPATKRETQRRFSFAFCANCVFKRALEVFPNNSGVTPTRVTGSRSQLSWADSEELKFKNMSKDKIYDFFFTKNWQLNFQKENISYFLWSKYGSNWSCIKFRHGISWTICLTWKKVAINGLDNVCSK